jgi:hypothetical protein
MPNTTLEMIMDITFLDVRCFEKDGFGFSVTDPS